MLLKIMKYLTRPRNAAMMIIVIGCLTGNVFVGLYLGEMSKPAQYHVILDIPLHVAAGGKVVIGAAVHTMGLQSDAQYRSILESNFNSITPENEMKMGLLRPNQTGYYWKNADYLVDYAESKNMTFHGHTLVWHSQVPDWLDQFAANPANDRDAWRAMLKGHIQTVVGRYAGRIHAWDVVNEVVDVGSGGENGYRKTIWYEKIGADYIKDAFIWAHQADPTAKLYWNDFGLDSDLNKLNFTLHLVAQLQGQGVPIDGIGFQTHISWTSPSADMMRQAVAMVNGYDVDVWVTELDITMSGRGSVYTNFLAQRQASRYSEVVEVFSGAKRLVGISTWGIYDGSSWLHQPAQNKFTWPLLFDMNYDPKPCAASFMKALSTCIANKA
jgi:endo-1,4-beta-xylanase